MKKVICAGTLALAMFGFLSNVPALAANEHAAFSADQGQPAATIDIARIRNVLRLSPEQERYWPAVEAALRNLPRQQQARSEETGLMRRISRRVVSVVLDGAAIQRLAVAARPLIAALDAEQMRAAGGLAQEMGLGPVVAALR